MNNLQALHSFWSGFGLKAYDAMSVPDDAQLPYITYEVSDDTFGNQLAQYASIWYRDSSWSSITAKSKEIENFISRGGRMYKYDGGAIWIQKSSPFAQRMEEPEDDMVRRIVLSVYVEFLE